MPLPGRPLGKQVGRKIRTYALSQNLQAHDLGEFPLAVVEGPKSLRLEFESGRDMQAVKGADSEFRAVTAAQILAGIESVFGYASWDPNPVGLILLQLPVHLACFPSGQLPTEDVLGNGVRPFSSVQCCEGEGRSR